METTTNLTQEQILQVLQVQTAQREKALEGITILNVIAFLAPIIGFIIAGCLKAIAPKKASSVNTSAIYGLVLCIFFFIAWVFAVAMPTTTM